MNQKRSKIKTEYIPYFANDDIVVQYELAFNDDIIKPGDRLKIKNTRGWYRFLHLAHNKKIDSTWVDTQNVESGEWKSFRVEQIKLVDRPKRSYRKTIGR